VKKRDGVRRNQQPRQRLPEARPRRETRGCDDRIHHATTGLEPTTPATRAGQANARRGNASRSFRRRHRPEARRTVEINWSPCG